VYITLLRQARGVLGGRQPSRRSAVLPSEALCRQAKLSCTWRVLRQCEQPPSVAVAIVSAPSASLHPSTVASTHRLRAAMQHGAEPSPITTGRLSTCWLLVLLHSALVWSRMCHHELLSGCCRGLLASMLLLLLGGADARLAAWRAGGTLVGGGSSSSLEESSSLLEIPRLIESMAPAKASALHRTKPSTPTPGLLPSHPLPITPGPAGASVPLPESSQPPPPPHIDLPCLLAKRTAAAAEVAAAVSAPAGPLRLQPKHVPQLAPAGRVEGGGLWVLVCHKVDRRLPGEALVWSGTSGAVGQTAGQWSGSQAPPGRQAGGRWQAGLGLQALRFRPGPSQEGSLAPSRSACQSSAHLAFLACTSGAVRMESMLTVLR